MSLSVCLCVSADRLAEDDVAAVLQRQVHGYRRSVVLHQQEDHGLFGLVTHHGDALCERGQEGVQCLAPFTWETHTQMYKVQVQTEVKTTTQPALALLI